MKSVLLSSAMRNGENWKKAAKSGSVAGFGMIVTSMINACLKQYDAETEYFDEGVRSKKRDLLKERILKDVQPTQQVVLAHIRSRMLGKFIEALESDLKEGKGFLAAANVWKEEFMSQFSDEISADAKIDQADWEISKVKNELRRDMDAHIDIVCDAKLSELRRLYEFLNLFNCDSTLIPRVWSGVEDIEVVAEKARSETLKLLSMVAVDRLDEDFNTIEKTLFDALIHDRISSGASLVSTKWDDVPPRQTFLSPIRCRSLWNQFMSATDTIVAQATAQSTDNQGGKLLELTNKYEKRLNEALSGTLEDLLQMALPDTWQAIRDHFKNATERAVAEFENELSEFELDEKRKTAPLSRLRGHARGIIEEKARTASKEKFVLTQMKDRFSTMFAFDTDSRPRLLSEIEAIEDVTAAACAACMNLLSIMAAIRLNDDFDTIEKTLWNALLEDPPTDTLDASKWSQVPLSETLLSPTKCQSLWKQFEDYTLVVVDRAINAVEQAMLARTASARADAVEATVNEAINAMEVHESERYQDVGVWQFLRAKFKGLPLISSLRPLIRDLKIKVQHSGEQEAKVTSRRMRARSTRELTSENSYEGQELEVVNMGAYSSWESTSENLSEVGEADVLGEIGGKILEALVENS